MASSKLSSAASMISASSTSRCAGTTATTFPPRSRRGDPRHHQARRAATFRISGVQHAPSDLRRHPRAPGLDAAVRFRAGQPQLLLRPLRARRRAIFAGSDLSAYGHACRCARARAAEALRRADPARHHGRQLPPAGHRRLGPRPDDAARAPDAAVGRRLRSRRHRAAQPRDQGALHLRDPGDDPRPGTHRARLPRDLKRAGIEPQRALGRSPCSSTSAGSPTNST